jgi:hypothetical protein
MMDTNRRRSNNRTSTPRLRCRYLCWLVAHTICWCLTWESSRIATALVETARNNPMKCEYWWLRSDDEDCQPSISRGRQKSDGEQCLLALEIASFCEHKLGRTSHAIQESRGVSIHSRPIANESHQRARFDRFQNH